MGIFTGAVAGLAAAGTLVGRRFSVQCVTLDAVFKQVRVYRLLTGLLVHRGAVHLLSAVLPWLCLGAFFEQRTGSFRFLFTILLLNFLISLLTSLVLPLLLSASKVHPALNSAFLLVTGPPHPCPTGLYPLLFALLSMALSLDQTQTLSLPLATLSNPVRSFLPTLCLLAYQAFQRGQVSIGPNLAGALAGVAFASGLFDRYVMDRIDVWVDEELEARRIGEWLPGFVSKRALTELPCAEGGEMHRRSSSTFYVAGWAQQFSQPPEPEEESEEHRQETVEVMTKTNSGVD